MLSRFALGVRGVAVAILTLAVLAPAPALADGPLNLELKLSGRCLSGHKPSDQPVRVRLLRRDGRVLETRTDTTTELEWAVCFRDHVPASTNRIRLTNGAFERTASVPDLTLTFDRVSNVVRGRGPAGKAIDIEYFACAPAVVCVPVEPLPVNANGAGRYRKDLSSSIDIDGSDVVRAVYTNSGGDRFYREGRAPWMRLTGPNRFSLSCLPKGTTTVRLVSRTGALRASKSFKVTTGCRKVSGAFRKNGRAVNIRKGDRIRSDFAGDARLTWPAPFVRASEYTVSGRCLPNADVYLSIDYGDDIGHFTLPAGADGRFSIVGYTLIPPGATLRIACESIRGDHVVATGKAT